MPELEDLSGPFNPDLKFEDFSKNFLLKLIRVWQFAWLILTDSWYYGVKEKFGVEAANELETAAWTRVGELVNPRYPKVANIELNDVLDSLKCLQLPLDNIIGGLYAPKFDIINNNHVIMTIADCHTLSVLERKMPERIYPICHVTEKAAIEKYVVNPKVKVTPLKLPPRKSPDEIACQWEFKLEE